LKNDIESAHSTWGDSDHVLFDKKKLEFVLFLASNFNNVSKVPYTLNYIARVLNGESGVVEYFKKHAIWDADDYLKEKIGYGFAELFGEYEGQLDESDDMFSTPGRLATAAKRNITGKIAAKGRASRKSDTELQKIVEIAKVVYGRPYSTGTIGGGKVYRLSIPARVNHDYRYVKLDSVSVDDKTILNQANGKFFDLLKQHGLDASRVDIKYHIGSGLYVSVRIKMKDVA
jgi:hypothetical protein